MQVELIHNTPLWVASKAIRKCWASEDKSDSEWGDMKVSTKDGWSWTEYVCDMGEKDKELIHRVGNKNKHSSTLEHLVYTFDIDGISRACLQELARHRMASYSVKSTRYTLKELKTANDNELHTFLVNITDDLADDMNIDALKNIRTALNSTPLSNDIIKYYLPEAYKTSLVMTINARSLQNFLSLRTSKSALWEIRDLANEMFNQLPEEHKYLFEAYIMEKDND